MTIMPPFSVRSSQQGVTLLEALVAILIFSLSLLGLIGIQASAIGLSIDAKHRADAAYLANQVISLMWVDRANLANYQHYSSSAPPTALTCAAGGETGPAASTKVSNTTADSESWVDQIRRTLPKAAANQQKIRITPNFNGTTATLVEVSVCWKRPQEAAAAPMHQYVASTQINP